MNEGLVKETIRVLLIDDQSLTDFLLRRLLLGAAEMELYYCENPQEGLRVAEACRPTVILLDFYMKEVGGLELLRRFRVNEKFADVPVLMLSVEENAEMKALAFAEGANDYLIKLPEREELIARLRYHAHAFFNTQRRHKAEEKYRKLFELSSDAIFLADAESGEITDCNDAAVRLMAMPRRQIIGMPQAELFPADSREQFNNVFKLFQAKGGPEEQGAFVLRADRELVPVTVVTSPFIQDNRSYTQWVLRDVSERKQLLKSLEEVLAVAEKASRAKSEFLATMSHEIRTPMNVIIGRTELLLEMELSPPQREHLEIINRAGETLLGLISNILDLSKIDAGRLELEHLPFDLLQLCDEVAQFFTPATRDKGITLVLEKEPGLPVWVIGDKLRLRQVLFNLLDNAVKFTSAGEIQFKIKRARRVGEEGMLVFVVNDTGIGIPVEKQELIFAPFTQADSSTTRKFGGTGLGLSICHRLVQMMGGRLRLNSAPDKGSTFFFTVPFELPEAFGAPSPTETPVPAPPPEDERLEVAERRALFRPLDILLADDSEDNRLLITAYLKTTPHRLLTAVDGWDAVTKFKNGTFDLILMDMQMPEMDGYEASRRIRQFETERGLPHLPIVAVTAYATSDEVEKSLAAGCNLHLTKPVKKSRLLEVIQHLAEDKQES